MRIDTLFGIAGSDHRERKARLQSSFENARVVARLGQNECVHHVATAGGRHYRNRVRFIGLVAIGIGHLHIDPTTRANDVIPILFLPSLNLAHLLACFAIIVVALQLFAGENRTGRRDELCVGGNRQCRRREILVAGFLIFLLDHISNRVGPHQVQATISWFRLAQRRGQTGVERRRVVGVGHQRHLLAIPTAGRHDHRDNLPATGHREVRVTQSQTQRKPRCQHPLFPRLTELKHRIQPTLSESQLALQQMCLWMIAFSCETGFEILRHLFEVLLPVGHQREQIISLCLSPYVRRLDHAFE